MRTTRALGRALVALVQERAFDAITVQDVLDRAGVGRTAFYAHYRDKHDVLFSSYDGLFAAFEGLVDRASPHGPPGALVESVQWWQGHPGAATPAAVDAAFHELARGVLRRPRREPRR